MMRTTWWHWLVLALLPTILFTGSPSIADEVVSKGTTLRGKVTKLSPAGVELAPEYGVGSLLIKWKDVESIRTDGTFQILYNDEDAIYSTLGGFGDGRLKLRDQEVEISALHSAMPIVGEKPSFRDRARSRWRYWDGSFDVAVNISQATVDTMGAVFAVTTQRNKAPTRFLMGASYRFSRQKNTQRTRDPDTGEVTKTTDTSTLEEEWRGLLRGEFDVAPRVYLFTSVDGEYDAVEQLSVRAVPKAGAGYALWERTLSETKKDFVRVEAGGAYVYENYFNDDDNNQYFSVAFGALAQYHLPFGTFDWSFDYLPAVDDWAKDYLLRTQASLLIPIFEPISLRAGFTDIYDNTPGDEAKKNSFYLAIGFSIGW